MRHSIPAAFYRGGTSKGLFFVARDLPATRDDWTPLFLKALGSPDAYGRQLDGMGGGISSLSKVAIVGPATVAGADVDYTFGQVMVDRAHVDYQGNCGNLLAAVGPFALEGGLLERPDGNVSVHIHNTNTGKRVIAHFAVKKGIAVEEGRQAIPGVAGTAAAIRLDFLDPGGATTGRLLPTGRVRDKLSVPGLGAVEVTLIDAGNACVLLRAADLGLTGTELPEALERDQELMERLQAIRAAASVMMGIAATPDGARAIAAVPYLALLSPAQPAVLIGGAMLGGRAADFTARVLASGQIHRALPLTVTLCLAVAARVMGTLAQEMAPKIKGSTRIAMPSGVLTVDADLQIVNGQPRVTRGSFYRTARRLMDGRVFV